MRKFNLRNFIIIIVALVIIVVLIGGCVFALLYAVKSMQNLEGICNNLIDMLKQYPAEMIVFGGICVLAGSIFRTIKSSISQKLK